jgi:hypothetical protein
MSQMLKRAARAAPSPALLGASYGDLNPNTKRLAYGLGAKSPLAHCVSQRRTTPTAGAERGSVKG